MTSYSIKKPMTLRRFMHKYLISIIFYGLIAAVVISLFCCLTTDKKEYNNWLESRKITEIYIENGDTLWNIAQQYKPNFMDIREYVYEIKQLNDIDMIYAGDIIQIYTID